MCLCSHQSFPVFVGELLAEHYSNLPAETSALIFGKAFDCCPFISAQACECGPPIPRSFVSHLVHVCLSCKILRARLANCLDVEYHSDIIVEVVDMSYSTSRFRRGALRVRLIDECLEATTPFEIDVTPFEFNGQVVRPSPELLDKFCELAEDDSDKKVARFARRHGLLGLCKHGLPAAHDYAPYEDATIQTLFRELRPRRLRRCSPSWREPVSTWRRFATEARAIRRIASELADERVGSREWEHVTAGLTARWEPFEERSWSAWLYEYGERTRERTSRQRVKIEREALVSAVQTWLELGLVRPEFVWSDDRPTFTLGGGVRGLSSEDVGHGELFAALAVQLMLDVSRPSPLLPCDGCGGLVTNLTRKPREDQRAFCDDCRRLRVPQKLAQRDYAARVQRHRKK